jgi:hypothetical protein
MRAVVLYTREGCCLCDDARAVLDQVQGQHPEAFAWQERDIDSDHRLHLAYLERIPVVTIDGEEAFELFLDESELKQRLGIVGQG